MHFSCLYLIFFLIVFAVSTFSSRAEKVILETSLGVIVLELDAKKAPITTTNFLSYADAKFYDNTIFHRVIDNFMIQGGGFVVEEASAAEKKTKAPIKNEAANGLSNTRGTIAMARMSNNPDSATAQFFINVKDNLALDAAEGSAGYAVFGQVVEGMDVVDQINAVATSDRFLKGLGSGGNLVEIPMENVPKDHVIIKTIRKMPSSESVQEGSAEDTESTEKESAEKDEEKTKDATAPPSDTPEETPTEESSSNESSGESGNKSGGE